MEEREYREIAQRKALLRAQIHARAAWSQAERQAASEAITHRLLQLAVYQQAKTIFCFVGTQAEIDTRAFLQAALQAHKTVCVPLCTAKGAMQARRLDALALLRPGSYGILEPPANSARVAQGEIEWAVLPCLCADTMGYRLGHGGGYYDRFFAAPDARKIVTAAVCRASLLQKELPHAVHDIPVNLVVTEAALYPIQTQKENGQ